MTMRNALEQYRNSISWLLEDDKTNPGPRFFTLTCLLAKAANSPMVQRAQRAVMETGPVPEILRHQESEGYWAEPAPAYGPKYTGTLWQIVFLAQLGADGTDARIRRGCDYVLDNYQVNDGGLSATAKRSGLIHCMQGNLVSALIDLGYLGDERLDGAIDWLARSVTGEGIAPNTERSATVRYLKSANSGPGFLCSANNQLPCAWGAIKVMLALSKIPTERRSPAVQSAIQVGLDFLLSRDPAEADYPMGYSNKASLSWFRFGYPIGYVTDVLQNFEVLSALGYTNDPRLAKTRELILSKRDESGRWELGYTYNGKTWVDVEEKGKPSKWVTLRALRSLKVTNDSATVLS